MPRIADHPLPNSAAALQQRKRLKILAIGSSPKAVLGPGRNGSPLLERILERTIKGLDVEIVNRGFSGELAEAAGERIRIEVALNEPHIVLWQVGTNDASPTCRSTLRAVRHRHRAVAQASTTWT